MNGTGVSPGISIGRAHVLKSTKAQATGSLLDSADAIEAQQHKYRRAVTLSIGEVEALIAKAGSEPAYGGEHPSGDQLVAILETHIEWLRDTEIEANVFQKIGEEKKNAHDAVLEVIRDIVTSFQQLSDEYLRERAADVQDIGNRLLKHLGEPVDAHRDTPAPITSPAPLMYGDPSLGPLSSAPTASPSSLLQPDPATDAPTGPALNISAITDVLPDSHIPELGIILIAEDLTPSDTIAMDRTRVIGFATQVGGRTSHAAIIARSRGIPAVVGCGERIKNIQENDLIVLDGGSGLILVNPGPETIEAYELKRATEQKSDASLQSLTALPAVTTDGKKIHLLANISGVADLERALEQGCEGVGLLRTELLFLERDTYPTEAEQLDFYKAILTRAGELPVTIRTLDIGGDKSAAYFGLPEEQNPFLGYRAIRICLDRKDLFLTQLRAILRASVFGSCRIMFPMIGNIRELRAAKEMLATAKAELEKEGTAFDPDIPVGIMIEVPSAAITADLLAWEVDFFSIGTNDLVQYTLAVDRMNEQIRDLYEPFDPGVLRLIRYTIEQAHKHRIGIGMCGELAGDPLATPLLVGMGLDHFSMSGASIPLIKQRILQTSQAAAEAVTLKVMKMDNAASIIEYLKETNLSET